MASCTRSGYITNNRRGGKSEKEPKEGIDQGGERDKQMQRHDLESLLLISTDCGFSALALAAGISVNYQERPRNTFYYHRQSAEEEGRGSES